VLPADRPSASRWGDVGTVSTAGWAGEGLEVLRHAAGARREGSKRRGRRKRAMDSFDLLDGARVAW
jgi:hypothetical protein